MFYGLEEKELMEFAQTRLPGISDLNAIYQYTPSNYKGRFKVSDPGHGWMVVRQTDPCYLIAARLVAFGYRLKSGTVLLEEDCEAQELLKQLR